MKDLTDVETMANLLQYDSVHNKEMGLSYFYLGGFLPGAGYDGLHGREQYRVFPILYERSFVLFHPDRSDRLFKLLGKRNLIR